MKKGMLSALALAALVTGLLIGVSPSSAGTPAYKHYVGCGLSPHATPSHVCPKGSKKGAFFTSEQKDVTYSVCVKFPSGKNLCAHKQEAKTGTLYVNKITSTSVGVHQVTWFVKGKKVGTSVFRVK